ncbi:MAG: MATE family efflux transporter [Phycisphaerales bacterium]|nr:MAG: MATE family efflux transporter [Phycisphaerales bacterium]
MAIEEHPEQVQTDRQRRRAEIRNVIAMAVPVVITTSSRALMDIADYTMITGLKSGEAQAAILPAQLMVWSYIVFGLGVVSMVSTFASQSMGRGEYRECSAYAWQSIYMAGAVGVIALAVRPTLPMMIGLIGHEPAVQQMELAYSRVALLTVWPTLAAMGVGWFFVGIHRPWITTWSVIEANGVNVVVSYILIFGHLGFEPMGIAGAAWGTMVGVCYRITRLTLTLVTPSLAEKFSSRATWKPSWVKLKELFRLGVPCGLHWVSEVIVWAIFVNVLVGTKFGTVDLIATSIAWQYMRIAFLPTIGVGQALTALVGKSIGAGDPERAVRETRIVSVITLAYMGSLSLIYWLGGAKLIGLFNSDSQVVEIGAKVMICAAVFQLFDAIGISYNSALRGAGDTFVPSVFFIISTWIIIIGGGWLAVVMYPQLGSLGPWLASSSFIAISAVFLWWRWHGRAWMRIKIFAKDRKAG